VNEIAGGAVVRHGRDLMMYQTFCRQLVAYTRYHRDPLNCATHYLGIPLLFLAAILPLEASRIAFGTFEVPLAIILAIPAVAGWMMLDLGVGATILLLLIPFFTAAELVDEFSRPGLMWSMAGASFFVGWFFQLLGHAVFERRRPAFIDDLSQTMIGPMFVTAKLLVWLGLRPDLAPFLAEGNSQAVGSIR
jgi:uncharacterized membrane protein YGL010W